MWMKGGKALEIKRGQYKYFDKVGSENTTDFIFNYRDFLFDLANDLSESYNVRYLHPEIAHDLT